MSGTKVATFVYPEEIVMRGAAQLVEDLVSVGVDAVNLAVLYHPARRIFQRHRRVSLSGPIHLAVQLDFGRSHIAVVPDPDEEMSASVLEFRRLCRDAGMDLRAWVVLLHVPPALVGMERFGSTYLDGTPSAHSLCPSWDEVRDEVGSICQAIVAALEPDGVLAEAMLYPGWQPDYSITLTAVDSSDASLAALSVCLCDACLRVYESAGVSPDLLRAELMTTAWDEGHVVDPQLSQALSQARQGGIAGLVDSVQSAIGTVPLRIGVFGEAVDAEARWWSAHLSDRICGTLVGVGESSGESLRRPCSSWAERDARALCFSRNRSPRHSGAEFVTDVGWLAKRANEAGVYHFGLLPDAGVHDLADASSAIRAGASR